MSFDDNTAWVPPRIAENSLSRSVNALFDSRDGAETARQDLIAAGIHSDDVVLLGAGDPSGDAPEPSEPRHGEGLWAMLKEMFMPEEDRYTFAEGVNRGGVTVSVRTDTANYDRVLDILDRDGAVDMDEREQSWRTEGWTGYTGQDPLIDAKSPSLSIASDEEDVRYAPASAGTAGFGASEADRFPVGHSVAPPVSSPGALPSSSLESSADDASRPGQRIAERDLTHGRSRVRAYVWGDTAGQGGSGKA